MIKNKDLAVIIKGKEELIPLTWDDTLVKIVIYNSGIGLYLLKSDIDGMVQISGMAYNLQQYNVPYLFGLAPELTDKLKQKVTPEKDFTYQGIKIRYHDNKWYLPDGIKILVEPKIVPTYNYVLNNVLSYCIRRTKQVGGKIINKRILNS